MAGKTTLHDVGSAMAIDEPQEESQFKHKLGDYLVSGQSLGQGSYAKVRLASHRESGELFAIKIIKKPEVDQEKHYTRIKREVENLKELGHPNIIQLHDVFQTKRFICIVMEFASGGDLFDYIRTKPHKRLPFPEAMKIFCQILQAVEHCHQKFVVHRDLKPENVLLDSDGNVKIADFGFSRTFEQNQLLSTCCGSLGYAAPELLMGEKYVGPAADVWSMGVILYTMLVGSGPFSLEEGMTKEAEDRMLAARWKSSSHLTPFTERIIQMTLQADPKTRVSIPELKRFLEENASEIQNYQAGKRRLGDRFKRWIDRRRGKDGQRPRSQTM